MSRLRRPREWSIGVVAALIVTGCGDNGLSGRSPRPTATPTAPSEPGSTGVRFAEVARAEEPTALVAVANSEQVLVAERGGRILEFEATDDGVRAVADEPFLDLTSDVLSDAPEQGLLGLAVDSSGRWLYVNYVARGGDAGTTTIQRFRLDVAGLGPEDGETIFSVRQPFSNHNGGSLVIGPDGALFVGMGDGGGQGDPQDRAQQTNGSFGRILRLDPDGSHPSTWVMGLRNPWRFSIDERSGDLWIGDVGGSEREEVDLLEGTGPGTVGGRGANLGWSRREGSIAPEDDDGDPGGPSDYVGPIYEYTHDNGGCSIVGGFRIRSGEVPELSGRYVFGDYCSGDVWTLDPSAANAVVAIGRVAALSSFGLDTIGRTYALSLDGPIYRIERA